MHNWKYTYLHCIFCYNLCIF